jgi:hypothetical protein
VRGSAVGLTLGLAFLLGPLGAASAQPIRAGAAATTFAVPAGTPLAGFGSFARRLVFPDVLGRHPHAFWFKPYQGVRDPLGARALVIQGPRARLLWVAVDLIAVDDGFATRVAHRLREVGVPEGTLILSASHTHAGPGAFLDSEVMALLAVDRPDRAVQDALVGAVVDAVQRADAAKVSARIGVGTGRAPALTRGRLGHHVDDEVVAVKVAAEDGRPVALLWNFAIHGTMLGQGNLDLSADVMGVATRQLEAALKVPVLFVNGAVGDVSPRRHGAMGAEETGLALANAVRAVWDRLGPGVPSELTLAGPHVVELPAPQLSMRNCLGTWVPRWLVLPLGSVFPRQITLTAGRLGPAAWVTMPGELQSGLGEELKRQGRGGSLRVFVAGLSNGYAGYFVRPADYDQVTYVTCATLYGSDGGQRLIRAARDLLATLGR